MKKVALFDRNILSTFSQVAAVLSTIATLFSLFAGIPECLKKPLGIAFLVSLVLIYLCIWISANRTRKAKVKINGSNVNIFVGDIFSQEGLKIIGVNDFYDTINDDKIIAKKTLHGQFLKKYESSIAEIDNCISSDKALENFVIEKSVNRAPGKSTRYQLGTVFKYDDYILSAFTKFNNGNEAWLNAEEYVGFWMNFWKNIDGIYAGRTINIPLMGAGITRFKNGKPSKQELLETMLLTLKISGFQCTYTDTYINFVVYAQDADEIDFYKIKKTSWQS